MHQLLLHKTPSCHSTVRPYGVLTRARCSQVLFWGGPSLALGVTVHLTDAGQKSAFGVSGERMTRRLRVLTLTNLMRQEIGFFDVDDNSSGYVSTKEGSTGSAPPLAPANRRPLAPMRARSRDLLRARSRDLLLAGILLL